ncbi:hypothetical protein AAMO2058_000041200 [Amorphochlora amoebiformis]
MPRPFRVRGDVVTRYGVGKVIRSQGEIVIVQLDYAKAYIHASNLRPFKQTSRRGVEGFGAERIIGKLKAQKCVLENRVQSYKRRLEIVTVKHIVGRVHPITQILGEISGERGILRQIESGLKHMKRNLTLSQVVKPGGRCEDSAGRGFVFRGDGFSREEKMFEKKGLLLHFAVCDKNKSNRVESEGVKVDSQGFKRGETFGRRRKLIGMVLAMQSIPDFLAAYCYKAAVSTWVEVARKAKEILGGVPAEVDEEIKRIRNLLLDIVEDAMITQTPAWKTEV